ncbi:MAG TPA: Crp/Fnr family transcriptional regulator [Verrucomicrobiae bacterium]|nr:Crp/Fnr family transcriptional regulator [Verrucomicrobiae bacterium]
MSKTKARVASSESSRLRPGERTNPAGKPIANSVLLSVPDDEFSLVRPRLEFVELPHHLQLHEPNRKVDFAYFPNSGMISLVVTTRRAESVEVGVVGNEGFTPVQIAAGLQRNPHLAVVQIAGDGFRIPILAMHMLLSSCPRFHEALSRYAAVHGLQVAQTAGCNRLHDLEQRLSRWLLLTQDRVGDGLLRITHDFLATMLGTDRPSVSLAANSLQKKHIIEYNHGSVRILNRKKLEGSACECYGVIHNFDAELALK